MLPFPDIQISSYPSLLLSEYNAFLSKKKKKKRGAGLAALLTTCKYTKYTNMLHHDQLFLFTFCLRFLFNCKYMSKYKSTL